MTEQRTKEEQLQDIGRCAMASIREMVAALECDYERLEELRDERDAFEPDEFPEQDEPVTACQCPFCRSGSYTCAPGADATDPADGLDTMTCADCGKVWLEDDNGNKSPLTWAQANLMDSVDLRELEEAAGECNDREQAEQRIHEDPLSLEFRSGWVSDWSEVEPEEYCLLLSTGGPAVRIIGEIRGGEAHSARLEVQDWWTPWTEYITTGSDHEALVTYARCFCMEHR